MTATPEFVPWPKTPRWNRDVIITEKLDGTNSAVGFDDEGHIHCQSRNRIITPGKVSDNNGFARWAYENQVELFGLLGKGLHFGEWWGQGVQCSYGLDHKRFSLFNVDRFAHLLDHVDNLDGPDEVLVHLVPVLYRGRNHTAVVSRKVEELRRTGSTAVRQSPTQFIKAEGVCIFHSASRQVYKVLLENDEIPKSLV